MQINPEVKRSALRYFGGKWAIAPWILEHMPPHKVYVEPFGGAASVLLRKPRSRTEVYNDLDEEVVGLFRVIQDPKQCQQLMRLLKRTLYARAEFKRAFEASTDPIIRSQRAIIRAYMSLHHSALFMPSKSGSFASSPGSGHKSWANYPRHLASMCRRLRGVIIEQKDAREVIRIQDSPDTLFFVDPPYLPSTRDRSTRYRHDLDQSQHIDLLDQLKAAQGKVMIAGYPSPLYDEHLAGWQRIEREHYARANGVRKAIEALWIKP
ncbi:MAG: DNA adenine methylase [Zoogloeaceae bacterium]|nr:DNA adenine methylase [Zoogloeaceae bacterium]